MKNKYDLATIPFKDLRKLNDTNSIVWMAIELTKEDLPAIEKFFIEQGFLLSGKILDAKIISGNVKGEDGRTDVVILFDSAKYDYIKRLRIKDLTWTSDFIRNCHQDYNK
jgi:hypothetical protein